MPEGGVSGPGLAIAAAGVILVWSGIMNRTVVESLRSVAMGQPIAPGPQTKSTITGTAGGTVGASAAAGGIVAQAAALKGTPYTFGGGHGSTPCSRTMDCSGYVSCVLAKVGALKGRPLTTEGLARWGVAVPFASRQPGDVLVWRGGPGGGHCGIVIDKTKMWHNPCTLCGGVQIGTYGSTKTGRTTLVRRAAGG